MSVHAALLLDLERYPVDIRDSAQAAAALALAASIDRPKTSATARALCAKELREALRELRSLAPRPKEHDDLERLRERRDRRVGGSAP